MNNNNNTVAVLFNSTPNSGKTAAIDYLIGKGYPLVRRQAKDKLHELVQSLFCIEPDAYWGMYNDRDTKELPRKEFTLTLSAFNRLSTVINMPYNRVVKANKVPCEETRRVSIREIMIYTSECLMKPTLGEDYFGVCRAKAIQDGEIVVDDSAAFISELPPLVERVGMENILLLRIHREGQTFDGDSRSYLDSDIIDNTLDIHNNGSLQEYLDTVEGVVKGFLQQRGKL